MDRVTPQMECYREELFGPVLQVMRADSYEEAIELVNAFEFGNGSAIFTRSGAVARRFQFEVEAGMVGINVPVPVPLPQFSFSGWKKSMRGDLHFFGKDAVRFFTKTRTVTSRWAE
jgi:malonate-semialdehyde dehydrogenase (acetylating)/methylmalonate-semialdehyde dehydrogenase